MPRIHVVSLYFTALEKIVLLHADNRGRITFPHAPAAEIEIWLETLFRLESRGIVLQARGPIPMLPFYLSPAGMLIRHALQHSHAHSA